jgi:hypothetical protein
MSVQVKTSARSSDYSEGRPQMLLTLAGYAAWGLLAYSLATLIQLMALGGQPESAQAGFALLAKDRLVGLLRLDVLTLLVMPLYYLLFLGLHAALRRIDPALALVAAALAFAGVTLFLATPSAFSFLTLSDRFAAAESEAQRTLLLAAGEAILAADLWHGSGALIGGLLLQTAALLASALMLRGALFGKLTAWLGVVTHGLDLLHLLAGLLLPTVGAAIMFVAGPLYLVWFPLVARDLSRLAREHGASV